MTAANPTFESTTVARSTVAQSNSGTSSPAIVASMRATVDMWWRRAEARRQLAQLSDRTLRDVGFDPEVARLEAEKPFWKPYTLTPSKDL